MKRLGYSILIGAACALLFLTISKSLESKRKTKGGFSDLLKKRASSKNAYYSAELQVAIGNPGDSGTLIEQTKDQILYRLGGFYKDLSAEKIDKNIYRLKANNILDTTVFKKAITESGKIEFSELFSLDEISASVKAADSALRNWEVLLGKQKELEDAKKKLDTTGDLSAILELAELEKSLSLGNFISFIGPFQSSEGSIRYTGDLGYVKTKDTSFLNKILNDPAITRVFPENLKFIYGTHNPDLYSDDSVLKLYAKKKLDKDFFSFPTGDQIVNAIPEFEPLNGQPVISFTFNSYGAQAWYLMTQRNINKPIAIIANNIVLTAPVVESAIEGGQSRITGAFSVEETTLLCKMMLSGELPLTPSITSADFKFHASKRMGLTFIILILFSVSTAATYGISLLIKPAPKP